MADKLNGQSLPVGHTEPYKNWNFQNECASQYFGECLWKLVHLLMFFFSLVIFMFVFDQTLVEYLYCNTDLLSFYRVQLAS